MIGLACKSVISPKPAYVKKCKSRWFHRSWGGDSLEITLLIDAELEHAMVQNEADVLIVDDDPDMRETISNILSKDGFPVRFAENGAEMRAAVEEKRPQIVLLDLMLPDENGFDLARELHANHGIPFIIISGKDDVIDKVVGLEIGADDYIAKPFHARELAARVSSVLRRASADKSNASGNGANNGNLLKIGDWKFDHQRQLLQQGDQPAVNLTTHEFKVLDALVRNAGNIISRDSIINIVSGRDWMPYDRSVDVVIGKLRKKLNDSPACPIYIKTVRNAGYSFVAKVSKL